MNYKVALAIFLALAIGPALLGLSTYSVEETVSLPLLFACLIVIVMLFGAAFVLFREGVRLVALRAKNMAARVIGINDRQIVLGKLPARRPYTIEIGIVAIHYRPALCSITPAEELRRTPRFATSSATDVSMLRRRRSR